MDPEFVATAGSWFEPQRASLAAAGRVSYRELDLRGPKPSAGLSVEGSENGFDIVVWKSADRELLVRRLAGVSEAHQSVAHQRAVWAIGGMT